MSNSQSSQISLENIIATSIKIPGVKVDRKSFLLSTFKDFDNLEEIYSSGPISAGITQEKLAAITQKLILTRTSQSSIASFIAGIPGGFAMAATIPADVLQFFGIALRLAQEISYIYGSEDLWENGEVNDDMVRSRLIMYCGVMFGVSGAVSGVRVLSAQLAKTTLKKLPQKALTKTIWYPVLKQIGKAIGIKITKSTVAQGFSKAIPLIGGVVSGSLNFASMMPMAKRLAEALDKAAFDYTSEEMEADIMVLENLADYTEETDIPSADEQHPSHINSSAFVNLPAETNSLYCNLETIKKLKELLDMDAITQEEYDIKKKELLGL